MPVDKSNAARAKGTTKPRSKKRPLSLYPLDFTTALSAALKAGKPPTARPKRAKPNASRKRAT